MDPLVFVVAVLATYRATLLVVADELTRPPREWAIARVGEESRWAYLIECPWCCSCWLAGPVMASALWCSDGWGWWLAAGGLAASAVTGFLASYASPNA